MTTLKLKDITMATKLKNTEFKKVIVNYRDPDDERGSVRVATNDVIVDGKRVLKQYTVKTDVEVELPVTAIKMLKDRYSVRLNRENEQVKVKQLTVEAV